MTLKRSSESKSCEHGDTGSSKCEGTLIVKSMLVNRLHGSVVSFSFGEFLLTGPEVSEHLKLCWVDRYGGLEDSPLDTFSAVGSGQRSLILPVLGKIEALQEGFGSDLSGSGFLISRVSVDDAVCQVQVREDRNVGSSFSGLEENSDDCSILCWLPFIIVNHVELQS